MCGEGDWSPADGHLVLFHASTFHNEVFYLLVLDVYITARNKIIIIMEERRDGETR